MFLLFLLLLLLFAVFAFPSVDILHHPCDVTRTHARTRTCTDKRMDTCAEATRAQATHTHSHARMHRKITFQIYKSDLSFRREASREEAEESEEEEEPSEEDDGGGVSGKGALLPSFFRRLSISGSSITILNRHVSPLTRALARSTASRNLSLPAASSKASVVLFACRVCGSSSCVSICTFVPVSKSCCTSEASEHLWQRLGFGC